MVIETKFEFDQEVFVIDYNHSLKKHLPIRDYIKQLHVQKNSENRPWIRYYLTLRSGLFREVDLFESREAAQKHILERGMDV